MYVYYTLYRYLINIFIFLLHSFEYKIFLFIHFTMIFEIKNYKLIKMIKLIK